MDDVAIQYYNTGYNCSQSIIKSVTEYFNKPVSPSAHDLCANVKRGFGVGNICCAIVGGTMALGLYFDEKTAAQLNVMLLDSIQQRFGGINCAMLSRKMRNDCDALVGYVADITRQIIEDNKSLIKA
jgi:C_GCAxxG_C_C family probable redox protein